MEKSLKCSKRGEISPDFMFIAAKDAILNSCNRCGLCVEECAFLDTHGDPLEIAVDYKKNGDKWYSVCYECSLCGLCTAVCPKGLDPSAMMLDIRRDGVESEQADLSKHRALLQYEKTGISPKYSFHSFPENCRDVFFPGCAISGTRPGIMLKAYEYLQQHISGIGIMLDCCTKPSHDLGRMVYFNEMFSEITTLLRKNGVETVIVACPSCYAVFARYAEGIRVRTIYEVLSIHGLGDMNRLFRGKAVFHDPCSTRFETAIHEAVRSVVKMRGLEIVNTSHKKEKTLCCGEGGDVGHFMPGYARDWTKKRIKEALPHKIVTYCAGCTHLLSKKTATFHVLDLVFEPGKTLAGKATVTRPPLTYLNRLKMKKRLKKMSGKNWGERKREKRKSGKIKFLMQYLVIPFVIIVFSVFFF